MKTTTYAVGISIACLLLFGCSSSDAERKAEAEKQQTAQRQEMEKRAQADRARAKDVALQEFENFRKAGTLTTAVQSLQEMDRTLAKVDLNTADISADLNEITGHLRDLARRPVAKPKPKVATRNPKNRRRRG